MNRFLSLVLILGLTNSLHAQDSTKVEKLNIQKLEQLSDDIITEQARLKEQLRQLEKNIQASTLQLQKVLAEANRAKFKSYVTTLSSRYDAGQEILYHIIKETNSFNLSFSQLVLQAQFSKLIDPTTYSEFNTAMNSTLELLGDRKPLPDANDVNNLKKEIPVLDNPLITTGLSIASYFLAKYHKRKKLENRNFKSMTCVLSFTNQTKKDYDIIIAQLYTLSKRLDDYNKASKEFFTSYLAEVGYSNGYGEDYPDEIDIVDKKKEEFFQSLLQEAANIGVISYESINDDRITYQIEQVKFLMNEYELILLEIKGFIDNYSVFVETTKERGESTCTNFQVETNEAFEQISSQLNTVKKNFNTVYVENRIPTPTKRNLFGLN